MTDLQVRPTRSLLAVAAEWVKDFQARLDAQDYEGIAGLFVDEGAWRDLVSFTWSVGTVNTAPVIAAAWRERIAAFGPAVFRLEPDREPREVVRAATDCLEVFLVFTTRFGTGRAVLRLVRDGGGYKAWTLATALQELAGFASLTGERRPTGHEYSRVDPGANWLDARNRAVAYDDREPEVLIVGGGQAGLGLAARLGQLQVDTLVVDKWPRIGDNWRQRYHTLTLHNEVWTCHLPYLNFPDTWPVYVPKDKLANWFESYVDAMEINYWTGTALDAGVYSDADQRWSVTLRKLDGTERVVRPKHVVMATGVSGIPHIPDIPGLAAFGGPVMHTSAFTGGASLAGKRVAIIGTGNSAHDVAQDLHRHGAAVTMLQRGATTVVDLEPASILPAKVYEEGLPLDDVDLIGISTPPPYSLKSAQSLTSQMRELDAGLIAALNKAGFRTDYGEDGGGLLSAYRHRGGGYYINVGASNLIIDGEISVRQWSDITGFTPTGIAFTDGDLEVDAIILATGYKAITAAVERHFGSVVADQIGEVWGEDETGELRNVWKRTAHPGLWFHAGSLIHCRVLSRYLALQIKGSLEGLMRT